MRLEPKVTDSGLVTLTNGKYSTVATDTYATPADAQTLIDTSIADMPTNAEAETIAEGVVAAVLPDGTDAGDSIEWDGAGWAIYRARDASGNTLLPITEGLGIKLDSGASQSYGWKDLIGGILPRTSPGAANTPTLAAFRGGNVRSYYFQANDLIDFTFHVPHDYAPGTDMFVHVHWGHNGTNISGSFVFDFYTTLAKGFSQTTFGAEKNVTLTVGSLAIETTPQYAHRTDEVQLTSSGGSATLIDTGLIEVDSLILMQGKLTTAPTVTGGSGYPFVFTIDIHYQSIGAGTTLNKAPDFYIPA